MDENNFNPLYQPTAEERKKRGYKYPDALTALKAGAARIAEIKRRAKKKPRKPALSRESAGSVD